MGVQEVHALVSRALEELAPEFTPDCRLLFVMHKPGDTGCWIVVGDSKVDELDGAIAAIEQSKAVAARSDGQVGDAP